MSEIPASNQTTPSPVTPGLPGPPAAPPPSLPRTLFPPPPPPPPPRRRAASFWMALVLLILLLFSVFLNVIVIGMALAAGTAAGRLEGGAPAFAERLVEGAGPGKIVLIDVEGVITSFHDGGLFGAHTSMAERLTRQLRQAAADKDVKAVILKINSPGGAVTASDVLLHEVIKLQDKGKKVVVHMEDLCASGGYYISASANWIVASPTTLTGSIGVIMETMDASELLNQKLGLKETPIKSGLYKDMGSIARPMTEDEKGILQGLIDDSYHRFVDVVAHGRNGHAPFGKSLEATRAAVQTLADGRVYSGSQAKDNGLADALGYLDDAIQKAKDLTQSPTAKVVRYMRRGGLAALFDDNADAQININAGVQVDAGRLVEQGLPVLEYRWRP